MTYVTDSDVQILESISRDVALLHSRVYGKAPGKEKTIRRDGMVVVLMEEVLTRGEAILCEKGRFDQVRHQREALQDEAEPLLRAIVEGLVGQPVRGFLSQVSAEDMAAEIFVL